MRVFISGGCKSGKSTYAEKIALSLAGETKQPYYIATMRPTDNEDEARIVRHRESRSRRFKTVELAADIERAEKLCDMNGVLLIDSVTALLANEMFGEDGEVSAHAREKTACGLMSLISAASDIVIVSDYIYSDAAFYDSNTTAYRDALAYLDRLCAERCDAVIESCCGHILIYKGEDIFRRIYEKLV